ncbi:MAG: GNAT family protein [Candidatus Gastranaerophilaceae bacterium]
MNKFIKIIIDRKRKEFKNIQYLPDVIRLYERFSKYLHDDYFLETPKNPVDAVIDLIEKISPFFWAVIDKKSGRFAGFGFLDNWVGAGNDFHSAEVTTCFYPAFWGKYTKICAKKFIKYCFKKYRLKKLKAYVFPQNLKVRVLLKKVGFKREALLKAETIKNGVLQDIEVYSIIRGEKNEI